MNKIVEAATAVARIPDHATVAIGGAGAGHAVPDKVLESLGNYFLSTGHPQSLTLINPCGIGDNDTRGLNHIAHEGLVKCDIGGFWGNAPRMSALARQNLIQGYNLPQGILSHLMRASASGKPGVITSIGLNTFVDPLLEGGKINSITTDDLVERIKIGEEDFLFYKAFNIDVAIIRGTTVDCEGNLTMEEEVGSFSMLSIAQAAKVNGGIVIAQAKRREDTHCDPGRVKVPGVFIDYIVLDPEQEMTFLSSFDESLVKRDVPYKPEELELSGVKRVIMRRAALELRDKAFVNLGYGISDAVPIVAREEDIMDRINFMIEQGAIGGIPTTGLNFGAMYNPTAILDDGYQFDFFHGGGLDMAFLGFAQVDQHGNINSTRFGNILTGCGGSIDISQSAKKVIYCGTFAVKSEETISEKGVEIKHPGKMKKFISQVEQISFNGKYAARKGQEVLYVTERAVFRLSSDGIVLTEIAPGVDLQKEVLDMMEFEPLISSGLKTMDLKIYSKNPLGLKDHL